MRPYGKAYSIVFALILSVVSIAYGAGDNPFVEEEKPKAAISPAGKGGTKSLTGGFRPESLNEALPFAQSPAPQPPARTERKWKIKGKVNDTVVISDEKGERIHVKNGEVFDGCLIQFPSALCDRDTVIKTLQETVEKEKKERIVLSKEALSLRTALEQKEKERADLSRTIDDLTRKSSEAQATQEKSLKEIEDLAFQKGDMENVLEQLKKEHEGVLVQLKEIQAAREQSSREVNALKAALQEKEAAAAKATAEAVKHKTDALSLLELTAQREQCSKELEQMSAAVKERKSTVAPADKVSSSSSEDSERGQGEAFGAGVLIEYVRKSGERVSTEEYGEIIVKEMNDSLIIGVSREHADQAERSLAKTARARIMQERFIFYLLEKGSIEFALPSPGEAVKAVQGQRVAG